MPAAAQHGHLRTLKHFQTSSSQLLYSLSEERNTNNNFTHAQIHAVNRYLVPGVVYSTRPLQTAKPYVAGSLWSTSAALTHTLRCNTWVVSTLLASGASVEQQEKSTTVYCMRRNWGSM
jgi:hypothetical protein